MPEEYASNMGDTLRRFQEEADTVADGKADSALDFNAHPDAVKEVGSAGLVEGAVAWAKNVEAKHAAEQAYFDGVDRLLKRTDEIQRLVDARKDSRGNYKTLSDFNRERETALLNLFAGALNKGRGGIADIPQAQAFSQRVEAFIRDADDVVRKTATSPQGAEQKGERSEMLDERGRTALAKIVSLIQPARTLTPAEERKISQHYTTQELELVAARIDLVARFLPEEQQRIFGSHAFFG